jgi:hypothetical protein
MELATLLSSLNSGFKPLLSPPSQPSEFLRGKKNKQAKMSEGRYETKK